MRIFLTLILSILISCTSVKPISFARTGEVECVGSDRNTISLISTGRGHTKDISYEYAVRNAFENLIFKGLPNSNQERPMVSNEEDSRTNHSAFYNSLLIKKDYQKFMINSEQKRFSASSGTFTSDVFVKIDLQALKNHLQENNITRKFGL